MDIRVGLGVLGVGEGVVVEGVGASLVTGTSLVVGLTVVVVVVVVATKKHLINLS